MRLDLSELAGTAGKHISVDIKESCPPDMDVTCTKPVKGKLTFDNTGTLLLMNGEIETEIKIECGRCLVDFTLPVESPIEEEFRLEKVGDAIQILPLDEEDTDADLVQNNILDVQELVRQALLVSLPIQPLCRPGCEGLCPTCGENLNVRKCQCPPAEPESPFKALADLLDEEDKDDK
jgi:uncharacterized protein